MTIEEKIKLRQWANRSILIKLSSIINANPQLRFQQILQISGIIEPEKDKFYEESVDTLNSIGDFIYKKELI